MSAKINVLGNACVITSSLTLEQIKTLEKYRPTALQLTEKDEDGCPVTTFAVSTGAEGKVGRYGITFNEPSRDDAKKATVTVMIPNGIADAKSYVADKYGAIISNLNKVEEAYATAAAEVEAERQAILGAITVA